MARIEDCVHPILLVKNKETPPSSAAPAGPQPTAKPTHGQIGPTEIENHEPERSRQHEDVHDPANEEEEPDAQGQLLLLTGGQPGREAGADQGAKGMREPGSNEVPRFEEVDIGLQALHIRDIDARRRRNQGATEQNQAHVDRTADEEGGDEDENTAYDGVHLLSFVVGRIIDPGRIERLSSRQ